MNHREGGPAQANRVQIPPRSQLERAPLFSPRLVIQPLVTKRHRAFFNAVEESRASLAPWLPWVPLNDSLEASRRYTDACERDWDEGRALRFYLRPRDRPDFLGVITLEGIGRPHRSCDLGYWLHRSQRGQGFMTEAARRVISFAFQTIGLHRIRCAAAVNNQASRSVVEKLGFKHEGIARDAEFVDGGWITHATYSLLSTDPQPDLLKGEQ